MLTLMTMSIVHTDLGCYRNIASKLLVKDGSEQQAEADTGKFNSYSSAAAVLQKAPQLSNTELKVDLTELVSHHIQFESCQ